MPSDPRHAVGRSTGSHSPATPGRTAIVTGGASGIGLGIAEALLDRGLNVVVADVREDHLAHAEARLSHHAGRLMPHRLDVTDRRAWCAAVDAIGDRFGAVDILCLNAGIGILGRILDSSPADWDWLMGVNLAGVTHGLETVLPLMRGRGAGGHVVATSSAGGLMVAADGGVYSSAKFGVVAAMDCLRAELAPEGIGVTTLCPAGVNTNIHDHETMRPEACRDSGLRADDAELARQQQAARAMLAKGADPRAVGRRMLRAVDDDASIVFTDGGIATVVELRRDALLRAARGSTAVWTGDGPERVDLAEPAGESAVRRALEAVGARIDVLDTAVVDAAAGAPERLGDLSDDAPLVIAVAAHGLGGSADVDWTTQVHQVLRRCFTIIRGLVPSRARSADGGGVAVVIPAEGLFADSARCADSVLGRSLAGLTEGLRAELLATQATVTLVLTGEGEEAAALGRRIRAALQVGPLYSLPDSVTEERVTRVFEPWLEELARTPSDSALPPLGPMGEVYRAAPAAQIST
jgi:NAD(P)-dependent dehydrogenase (short-subunit alcohol dehydrogenase family)